MITNIGQGIWETDPSTKSLALVSFETLAGALKTHNESLSVWEPIMTVAGCKAQLRSGQFQGPASWFEAYSDILPLINAGGLVGINLADLSRSISTKLINSPKGRESIKEFIISSPVPFIFQNGK